MTGAVAGMLARARRPPVTGLLPDATPATSIPVGPAPAEPTRSEAAQAPGRAPTRDIPVAAPVHHGRPRIAPRTSAPLPDSDRVTEPASFAAAPEAVTRRPDPAPNPTTGLAWSRSTPPPHKPPAAARSAAPGGLVEPALDPSASANHLAASPTRLLQRAALRTDPAGPDGRSDRDTVDGGPRLPSPPVDGPTQRISPGAPDAAPATAPVRAGPVSPVVIESIRVEVAGPAGPAPDPFAGLRHHLGGITRWGRR